MQRVLIVDDNDENRYFLEVLLSGNGYGVSSAQNGIEALQMAHANPPDLVVSDILMPVMDGYSLCRAWRSDPLLRQIPFMFYSATFTSRQDEALALNLGANQFVIKPQEPDLLLESIRKLLAAPSSQLPGATPPVAEQAEKELLKEYSESLFRKLEKKMAELEQANRELAASADHFRHFVMECPIPIAVSTQEGRIDLLNERFVATFGYTRDDIPTIQAWWERAYPDPDYRNHVCQVWQISMEDALGSGGIVHAVEEFRITCKDGMQRDVQIYAAPVSDMLLVVFNDVTERKQAEQERAVMQAQMIRQDKMASIGQLAAGVAHEINSPVGFVRSNLQTLASYTGRMKEYLEAVDRFLLESSPSAAAEILAGERKRLKVDVAVRGLDSLLQDCTEGTERIIQIVQNLKVFVHHDTMELQPIDLNLCCDSIVRIIWSEIKYVATLKREYGLLPPVTCNSQQISQVVMNLLVNAAQAIREQGVITLRTWLEGDTVLLSVSDSGCGIAPENLQKVFEAFFTTKEIGKGTGLGLSISADIVHKHGGEITVQSEPGVGTTFTVRLPAAVAQLGDQSA